jgi:hypothetical protein
MNAGSSPLQLPRAKPLSPPSSKKQRVAATAFVQITSVKPPEATAGGELVPGVYCLRFSARNLQTTRFGEIKAACTEAGLFAGRMFEGAQANMWWTTQNNYNWPEEHDSEQIRKQSYYRIALNRGSAQEDWLLLRPRIVEIEPSFVGQLPVVAPVVENNARDMVSQTVHVFYVTGSQYTPAGGSMAVIYQDNRYKLDQLFKAKWPAAETRRTYLIDDSNQEILPAGTWAYVLTSDGEIDANQFTEFFNSFGFEVQVAACLWDNGQ